MQRIGGSLVALAAALVVSGLLGSVSSARAACADANHDAICDDLQPFCDVRAIREPIVTIRRLTAPAGTQTLRLSGLLVVPADPPIDPAASGMRLTLARSSVSGVSAPASLFDVTVPGGGKWGRRGKKGWTYRDRAGSAGGIRLVALKEVPAPAWARGLTTILSPLAYAFVVEGGHQSLAFSSSDVPVFDLSLNTSAYQCGQTLFYPSQPLERGCSLSGGTLRCVSGNAPAAPCHLSDPSDLVACDISNAALAEEAYFAAHGTYFSGRCRDLPGFVPSPRVTCSATGGATSFSVATSHPYMWLTSGCTWNSAALDAAGHHMTCS